MTRVVVADDQDLVRAGFRLILERNGVEVAGEARDGIDAVAVTAQVRPDVVLMDIRMPRLDGIEATRRIVAASPSIRVLVLTTFDLDEYVYEAVRAGASGFLLKDVPPSDLVHAVSVGRGPISRVVKGTIKTLTPRALRKDALGAAQRRAVYSSPPPADPELTRELRSRYREEVVALGEYLDRDLLELWGYGRDA